MIKQFLIAARQRIAGISVEAHLVVLVDPPQTDKYETLKLSAQLELRELLALTYHSQKQTYESLNGSQGNVNLKNRRPPRRPRVSPQIEQQAAQAKNAAPPARGRAIPAKRQPSRAPRRRSTQAPAS